MFRDWNTYDAWDTEHYLISRRWEAAPDNVKDFYETGKTVNTNVGIEGGNDKAGFRLSFAHLDQTGIFPNSHLKRNNAGIAGNAQLSPRLTAQATVNLGLNDGPAAGQTMAQFHLHVIPRYAGDVPDPRGGVRWIIPAKARYWA